MPFYKEFTELEKGQRLHAHVLPVLPDDPNSSAAILLSAGVTAEGVFGQPLDALKVTGTPTLLLLNESGKVQKAWVGALSPQGEKEVLAAVEQ